jgi:hypothetical protein
VGAAHRAILPEVRNLSMKWARMGEMGKGGRRRIQGEELRKQERKWERQSENDKGSGEKVRERSREGQRTRWQNSLLAGGRRGGRIARGAGPLRPVASRWSTGSRTSKETVAGVMEQSQVNQATAALIEESEVPGERSS